MNAFFDSSLSIWRAERPQAPNNCTVVTAQEVDDDIVATCAPRPWRNGYIADTSGSKMQKGCVLANATF
jgi:hypothetical protein